MQTYTYPQSVRAVITFTGPVTNPSLALMPPRGGRILVPASSLTSEGGNAYSYIIVSPVVGQWLVTGYGTVGGVAVATSTNSRFTVQTGA